MTIGHQITSPQSCASWYRTSESDSGGTERLRNGRSPVPRRPRSLSAGAWMTSGLNLGIPFWPAELSRRYLTMSTNRSNGPWAGACGEDRVEAAGRAGGEGRIERDVGDNGQDQGQCRRRLPSPASGAAPAPERACRRTHQAMMISGARSPLNLQRIDSPEQTPASAKPNRLSHEFLPAQACLQARSPEQRAARRKASQGASDIAR